MEQDFSDKRILLGVTGSIAAYKAALLIRQLTDSGCQVQAVLTDAGAAFIGTATLQALTGRPVLTDMHAPASADGMDHIAAVRAADALLIAPATAHTLGRLANGLADDLLSALAAAADCPILAAPAMNQQMWANRAVARNIAQLKADGCVIIEPGSGPQACGETGPGRMAEPEQILAVLQDALAIHRPLAGKTVAVSAGAIASPLDSIRVLTNRSSGRMGCAIASAAKAAGAKVILLAGRLDIAAPPNLDEVISVPTNDELLAASLNIADRIDAYIGVAAVADWQPERYRAGKPARTSGKQTLVLKPTADIIAAVAALPAAPFCMAFAAEAGTSPVVAAQRKMRRKKVDAIVACPVPANLESEDCDLVLVAAKGKPQPLGKTSKRKAARLLIAEMAKLMDKQRAAAANSVSEAAS